MPRTYKVAVFETARRMRLCVPDQINRFVGVGSCRNFDAVNPSDQRVAEIVLLRARSADYRRRWQHRVGNGRIQFAVEGNQARISRRCDGDHKDIICTQIARGKIKVIPPGRFDICQQGADGFPGRREDIKTRAVCVDDTVYQGNIVAVRVVENKPLGIGDVWTRLNNSARHAP